MSSISMRVNASGSQSVIGGGSSVVRMLRGQLSHGRRKRAAERAAAGRLAQNAVVPVLAEIAAAVAALIHVWFFALESVLFGRPTVWRRFGVRSAEDAAVIRPMAFNQGFYNLFLAVGVALGLLLVAAGNPVAGRGVVVFAWASMVAAGAGLAARDRRFAGGAAIRPVPPLIALLATLLR